MLKRILQTLLLCCAAIVLTTKMAISSPLPNRMLIADHTPDHPVAVDAGQTPPVSPQLDKPNREQSPENPVIQADPSIPYDPYDYDAIRESNRQIYGELKGKKPE
jgi:hypothetical protein